MKIINNKYYIGFEGEPEIQFVYKKDNVIESFIMWEGYFDQIMKLIKPDKNEWKGVAYCYNMHIGWYEEDYWRVEDLLMTLKQFESIDKQMLNEEASEVLKEICNIIKRAEGNKAEVFIIRE
ncbi:hypothetical protein AAK894_02560 [Lachnospiraceae bacterium 46-61]